MAKPATKQQTFASILDKPASEIERPKPLPQGSYTAVVAGMPRFDKSTKKQTDFVEFTLNLLAAGEDVDAEELVAAGGVEGKSRKATFYLTEQSGYRLKEFLEHCGVLEEGGTMRKAIDSTPNCQVGITIRHEPSQDGTQVYDRIVGSFPIEG